MVSSSAPYGLFVQNEPLNNTVGIGYGTYYVNPLFLKYIENKIAETLIFLKLIKQKENDNE